MFQVRWYNDSPFCWQYSIDGGETWENLEANDPDDPTKAFDEASKTAGMAPKKWAIFEEL